MKNEFEWLTIDGNWTKKPVAYCKYHKGVLTTKLMRLHKCTKRKCRRLEFYNFEEVTDDSGANKGDR